MKATLTRAAATLTFCLFAAHPTAASPVQVTELYSGNSSIITFRVILQAGSADDAPGKEGMNALTALMIAEGGTKDLTYQQVVSMLYPWAAGMYAQPDKEITTFVAAVHADHLEKFYPILRDRILAPRFDPEDFSRNKDLLLSGLRTTLRAIDDENLGKEALILSMFPAHPYGTAGGTIQGLEGATLDDVRAYHGKMYTTGRIRIGIAGGYPAGFVQRMRQDFAALPAGGSARAELPAPRKAGGLELVLVEKPARAVAISLGHPIAVTRRDRDFYALMVANSHFGEHRTFNGVLMNRIRGDRGLNYGAYSYVERFVGGLAGTRFPDVNTPLQQQYFSIWLRPVPPEKAHFALRAAMYELDRFVKQGLTREQFEQSRTFLANYSRLWGQTLGRRLGYKMDAEFYGITDDYFEKIQAELRTLTVDEVNRAVARHIDPENLFGALVVPDAASLKEALLANAPSPITYATPAAASITEEDERIAVFPLPVHARTMRVVHAGEMFTTPGLPPSR